MKETSGLEKRKEDLNLKTKNETYNHFQLIKQNKYITPFKKNIKYSDFFLLKNK